MKVNIANLQEMESFGVLLGSSLSGGECIELVGDVGAGKTTLTKSIAKGMGIDDTVQSPTFTLSRIYDGPNGIRLAHYDFYRLTEAGIMADELDEAVHDEKTVVIVEWADAVRGVIPEDSMRIAITSTSDDARSLEVIARGGKSTQVLERMDA